MKCLTEAQLLAFIDGGVPPNERPAWEAHLAACGTCRASLRELEALVGDLSSLPELDEDAHVGAIMARLDSAQPRGAVAVAVPPAARSRPRWMTVGGALLGTAAAAAVVLSLRGGLRGDAVRREESAFAARGGPSDATLARDVGVRVLIGTNALTPLASGATVAPDASFACAYTNLHDKPAYLLLFALDRAGDVHWLYPPFVAVGDNPASVALARAPSEVAMKTSVVLGAPAVGTLRFVSIVTEEPLHVHDIEDRHAEALSKEALERAFPHASVSELSVRVASEIRP